MKKSCLLESVAIALVLGVLVCLPLIGVASARYPGPDYAEKSAGDLWHAAVAKVRGYYYDSYHYLSAWHRSERWATWPNIYTGNLSYRFLGETYDLGWRSTSGSWAQGSTYYIYAEWVKTQSQSGFHNVITKATWTQFAEISVAASP
jgi:hypothetical protein